MYFKRVIKSEVRFNGLDLFVSTNETKFYPGFRDLDQDVNCHILTFIFSSGSDHKCYLEVSSHLMRKNQVYWFIGAILLCHRISQVRFCFHGVFPSLVFGVLIRWTRLVYTAYVQLIIVNNLLSVIWNSKRSDPAQGKGDHRLYRKPSLGEG